MSLSMTTLPFVGEIGGGGVWMPTVASTFAEATDPIFFFIYYLCVIFFVLIIGATFGFAWKYRQKSPDQRTSPLKHNTRLEFLWSAIPTVLLVVMFAWGQRDFVSMSTPPADAMEVNVIGQKWNWTVEYPDDAKLCKDKLVVPVHTPVSLRISAEDVLHAFYIPAFRLKRDAVPNRYTGYWFEATETGIYDVFCAEYCGTDHSLMMAEVHVLEQADYDRWLASGDCALADPEKPDEYGPFLYKKLGCNACHSLEDTKLVGPSFKGLYGSTESLTDGTTVTVDDAYIRESILEPNSKLVSGFGPQMPSFKGRVDERDLNTLIYFIKQQAEAK